MSYYGFRPYLPVAKRRILAARELEKLKKKGHIVSPVVIEGRTIARNFWGKSWCENLERYSDYANRLPRGRTYVRNGSVVDLQIECGQVRAMVSGSDIYSVRIEIGTVSQARWKAICKDCLGSIGSLVELLQGKLSKNVMELVCREGDGLFPSPREIKMTCSCPQPLAYATTKGAIQNFTGGLAQLLAEWGIRANTVAPGPVWTPLIPSTMPPEKVKHFGEQVPIKRPAQPKELAPVYVMLASNEASYVSGATVAVTGGKPII
jgi:NAD(P)-dependent dehydrogenase (short-subunit alcohol dehydrogenase family)